MPDFAQRPFLGVPRRPVSIATLFATILMVLVFVGPSIAGYRYHRLFNEDHGLSVAEVQSLAQDSRHFLWIGTSGGLYRFDGRRFLAWHTDILGRSTDILATGQNGSVVAGARRSALFEVVADSLAAVLGPGTRPISNCLDATFDATGDLWVLADRSVHRRSEDGSWWSLPADRTSNTGFYRLYPRGEGGVYVAMSDSLRVLGPDLVLRAIAPVPRVRAVVELDERIYLASETGGIGRITQGTLDTLLARPAEGLAVRNGVVWACVEGSLCRLDRTGEIDWVAPGSSVLKGRRLLVDHEGSLWLGGYFGLAQFPEPETVSYAAVDGLPPPTHARWIEKHGDTLFVATWQGCGRMIPTKSGWECRSDLAPDHWGRTIHDASGRLWTADRKGFLRWADGRYERVNYFEGVNAIESSFERADGHVWVCTSRGLFVIPPGGVPRPVATPGLVWPTGVEITSAVHEDAAGRIWLSQWNRLAHASADLVLAGVPVTWTLQEIPCRNMSEVQKMPSGAFWAPTDGLGLIRGGPAGWEPIPGGLTLGSWRIECATPSAMGGVWVLGAGLNHRVEERTDLPEGLRVLEVLSAWNGLPGRITNHLLEESDGSLWLASLSGIIRVPASARLAPKSPPRVELTGVWIDGERVSEADRLEASSGTRSVELQFAALSFRDPGLIRYQVRSQSADPWIETNSPDFHLSAIGPGRHEVQVRASLDAVHWSPQPARIDIRVRSPWYRQTWAHLLAALLLAGATYVVYRIRLAYALGLERQRTRIAMDLHDELGSALGSIGILGGLASSAQVEDRRLQQLGGQIVSTATELAQSLRDIVWSLRTEEETLEALALYLADRGAQLFPDETTRFAVDFPSTWPSIRLPLDVRRNVQLMVSEALHNAARHAGASRVELGVRCEGHDRWRLWVTDDGIGLVGYQGPEAGPCPLGNSRSAGGGMGLVNMRRRAEQIGMALHWTENPGGGVRVDLAFDSTLSRVGR